MSRLRLSVAVLVAAEALAPPAFAKPPKTSRLVINDVAVIDTRTGNVLEHRDVLIQGDRIVSVESARAVSPGAGATVLDGRGKFLIPGLWDMEVHLSWTTASALPLLIVNGITDVRDMGSNLEEIESWRSRISAGSVVGPYIFRVGPMLNGKSFNQYQMVIGPPEQARGVVRTLKFIGVDGLSLERRVPRDSYFALMSEAKQEAIPVGGHIPIGVTPEEASDAGQATIENADTLFEGMLTAGISEQEIPDAISDFLASDAPDKLFQRFVKNRTAYTPAIAMFQWSLQDADPSAPKDMRKRYVAKSLRDFSLTHPLAHDDLKSLQRMFPGLTKVVERMSRDGVLLLAGTDIAGPRIPGFSVHDELSMLVKAGLTPFQALQTATLNPAAAIHRTKDFGTLEPGRFADIVLLDANPLENIDNTQRIAAVVARGRLFRRQDLDDLLRQAQRLADQN
jgi:imidazolonepropionase-like amidohydrolase